MEKLIVVGESVNFYSKPNDEDTNIRTVIKDDEFYISKIGKVKGEYWIQATIDDEFEGYIKEGSKVAVILPVKIAPKRSCHLSPTNKYFRTNCHNKEAGILFLIHKTFGVDNNTKLWDKVRLRNGKIGYMNSETKVVPINYAENSRKKYCLYAVVVLYLLNISRLIGLGMSDMDNGGSIDSSLFLEVLGFAVWSLIGAFFLYHIIVVITSLFKSKMEKYYYPYLTVIYNNQIL